VVGGELEQGRALQRGVLAAPERLLEAGADLGRGQVLVRRRHHERRAGHDPQDLRHALPRLLHRDAARRHVGAAGEAVTLLRDVRIELGRGLAAPHRLDVDDQVHQVLDGRLVVLEAHRVGARQREPECELGLREPGVELVPEAPGRDRIGRRLGEEHALPRDQHLLEPELPVQLVEAAAERREERVRVTGRDLPAEHGDAARAHRHDERGPVAVTVHAGVRADVDVLRVDRARVHADLAAQHEAGAGLADYAKRCPLVGVLAEAVADGGRAGREREEAPGAGERVAIRRRARALLGRDLALPDHVLDAERDEVPVARRVGHVARGQEDRRGVAPAHRA